MGHYQCFNELGMRLLWVSADSISLLILQALNFCSDKTWTGDKAAPAQLTGGCNYFGDIKVKLKSQVIWNYVYAPVTHVWITAPQRARLWCSIISQFGLFLFRRKIALITTLPIYTVQHLRKLINTQGIVCKGHPLGRPIPIRTSCHLDQSVLKVTWWDDHISRPHSFNPPVG